MKLSQIPHVTEEYYCSNCKSFLNHLTARKNWRCDVCNTLIEIRILTDKFDNSCSRILIEELQLDDHILIDRTDEFRRILNLKDENTTIRTAIKGYTVINLDKGTYVIKLNGGWYH